MRIKNELHWFRVEPLVYKVGVESQITICANDPKHSFEEEQLYRVEIRPLTRYGNAKASGGPIDAKGKDGKLIFDYTFDKEEEYYLRIFRQEEDKRMVQLSVYALREDLYQRRPLRGDLHIHSCRSDGRESPAVVAANYRSAGFDFIALTDHHRFAPSLEMIEAFAGCKIGMTMMTGEEVHSPDNFVHILNVGGAYSVNDIFANDKEAYYNEVADIASSLDFVPEVYKFAYAACVWVSGKIRQSGGIAIFAHPHWMRDVYNVPDELTEALFNNNVFDAFELIGGFNLLDNNIQIALYNEMRSKGLKIPIVGSSDSHTTINNPAVFNARYTVVFAKDNSPAAIKEAILDGWSLAYEEFYPSDYYMGHGSYRLCMYGKFLRENYFPIMSVFGAEEGLLMREHICGDEGARDRLNQLTKRTENYYKKMFGKS